MTDFQKGIGIICMILGRLELFTLLVLLSPSFWRR
jgi:trk system potassium uptake protein TrkH